MKNDSRDVLHPINNELKAIDLFKILSKRLRIAISIAMTLTSLSIFSSIYVIADYERLIANLGQVVFKISWAMIILFVCLGIFFVGTLFLACVSTVALLRLKVLDQNIKVDAYKTIEEFSQKTVDFSLSINKLNSQINQLTLSEHILDEEQITALESGMFCGGRIIVMTSKFHLDTGKLVQVILSNIKKGVIYQYIVPGKRAGGQSKRISGNHHADFTFAYTHWWELFKEDLFCAESPETVSTYDPKYQELKKFALDVRDFSQIEDAAKEYFSEHVQEFLVSTEYSLITVIMYQKGVSTDHNFNIIIKLPTVSDDNYFAFKIPDEEKVEKKNLSDIIEAFCRKTPITLKLK